MGRNSEIGKTYGKKERDYQVEYDKKLNRDYLKSNPSLIHGKHKEMLREAHPRIFSQLLKEHQQSHWGKGGGNKGGDTK